MKKLVLDRLSASLLIASVVALAPIPGEAGAARSPWVTNPQVRHFYRQAKASLTRSDLASARTAAIQAAGAAYFQPRFAADGVPMWFGYLFPEGEALRFFVWERASRLLYIEIRNGSARLVWQAHFKRSSARLLTERDTVSRYISSFLNANRTGLDDEFGARPTVDQPMVFFQAHPSVGSILYGRITREGTVTDEQESDVTGKKVYGHEIVVEIPDERVAGPGL